MARAPPAIAALILSVASAFLYQHAVRPAVTRSAALGRRRTRRDVADAAAGSPIEGTGSVRQQIRWGKALTDRNATSEEILSLFAAEGRRFSARNLATCAHRAAKTSARRDDLRYDPRARALADACCARVSDLDPQGLANTAWAFAKAGVDAPRLFTAIADAVPSRVAEFNAQGLANAAWAFATAGVDAPLLFDAIADEATPRMHEFKAQEIANTAWAFATAGVDAQPRLFVAIADAATESRLLSDFKAQELANTAWAFAKMDVDAPRLFDAIADVAPSKLGDFSAQGLSMTAWAFAKTGVHAPRLFDAIADLAPSRLSFFSAHNVANTAWAFATAGVEAPRLFVAIAQATASRLGNFNPQDLANTAWAFATAGVEAPHLFTAIANVAQSMLPAFTPQALADMAWAFATAGVEASKLFAAIADVAPSKLGDLKPQELANTAWAFATVGVDAPPLFDAIADVAQSRLDDFNPQDLANTAWAFACVDWKTDPQFFVALADASAGHLSAMSDESLSQLHLVSLHCRLEWPDDPSFHTLSRDAEQLQAAYVRRELAPSRYQRDVAAALDRLGWTYDFQYRTAEGLSLGMAQPDAKLAVEADDPVHFLMNAAAKKCTYNGGARFKSRLLRRLGWSVVHVPAFEFRPLKTTTAKDPYLAAKLGLGGAGGLPSCQEQGAEGGGTATEVSTAQ